MKHRAHHSHTTRWLLASSTLEAKKDSQDLAQQLQIQEQKLAMLSSPPHRARLLPSPWKNLTSALPNNHPTPTSKPAMPIDKRHMPSSNSFLLSRDLN